MNWVRFEIENALLLGKPIIPVLLEGARPLKAWQLPRTLKPLATVEALAVRRARDFERDVDDLVKTTQKNLGDPPYPAGAVFVCYHHGDEADVGRICERLDADLGAGATFAYVQGIEPGADFARRLVEAIRAARVVVLVVGHRWVWGQWRSTVLSVLGVLAAVVVVAALVVTSRGTVVAPEPVVVPTRTDTSSHHATAAFPAKALPPCALGASATGRLITVDAMEAPLGWLQYGQSPGSSITLSAVDGLIGGAIAVEYSLSRYGWVGISRLVNEARLSGARAFRIYVRGNGAANSVELKLLYGHGPNDLSPTFSIIRNRATGTGPWQCLEADVREFQCWVPTGCVEGEPIDLSQVERIDVAVSNKDIDDPGTGLLLLDELQVLK